jgi:hypothetical protein
MSTEIDSDIRGSQFNRNGNGAFPPNLGSLKDLDHFAFGNTLDPSPERMPSGSAGCSRKAQPCGVFEVMPKALTPKRLPQMTGGGGPIAESVEKMPDYQAKKLTAAAAFYPD